VEKIVLSESFKTKVREAWQRGSRAVLTLAQNEAWNLDVHGKDFDDQIADTGDLGILCGETRTLGVEAFFEQFTVWVNRNYEADE
jgi:hypothetical protein